MEEDHIKQAVIGIADRVRTNPDMTDGEVMDLVGTVIETIAGGFLLLIEKLDNIAGELEEIKEMKK